MDTITIKLEEKFAKNVEKAIRKYNYSTKTEFIREAIRDKIHDLEKEESLTRARKLFGTSKLQTTDEQRHKAGEEAFEELEKELK